MKAYGLVVLACAVLSACVEPTAVRRTLLIPSPMLPARVGAPLDPLHGRVALELSSLETPLLMGDFPNLGRGEQGEPGVLVPRYHLGASLFMGVFEFWEVGLRFSYTHANWAEPNFRNVIELPDTQDRGLYQASIGHRINVLRDAGPWEAFNAALLLELGVGAAPEAVYCQPQRGCESDVRSADRDYVVDRTSSYLFLQPHVAALIGAFVHEQVFLDLLAGATTSLRNIGFDSIENIDDDTNGSFWVGYIGGGIDVRYEVVFATLHLYMPFEDQGRIYFGPRLSLQAGYAF